MEKVMSRLSEIRETLQRDRRGEINTVIFGAHARSDIPYLLNLVDQAIPWVENATIRIGGFYVEEAEKWLKEVQE